MFPLVRASCSSPYRPFGIALIATVLEVTGNAIIRKFIYNYSGPARIGFMLPGAMLLFGYGFPLNLAPVEFGVYPSRAQK